MTTRVSQVIKFICAMVTTVFMEVGMKKTVSLYEMENH